jgi:hypothetical protein
MDDKKGIMPGPEGQRDVRGGDPELPDKTKEAVEKTAKGVKDALRKPKNPTPEDLKLYPNYYRLREKLKEDRVGYISAPRWHWHHDDERFDHVTIEQVERYKTSGLSGNEWRFSTIMKLWWKGIVIASRGVGGLEHAMRILDHWVNYMQEHMMFEHDEDHEWRIHWPEDPIRVEFCFQPGCCEKAVNTYRLKKVYTRDGTCEKKLLGSYYVRYCNKHSRRGNSHMTDNDDNMVLVDGMGRNAKSERHCYKKESPSAFGGIIDATQPRD